jgi:hypothetical protein
LCPLPGCSWRGRWRAAPRKLMGRWACEGFGLPWRVCSVLRERVSHLRWDAAPLRPVFGAEIGHSRLTHNICRDPGNLGGEEGSLGKVAIRNHVGVACTPPIACQTKVRFARSCAPDHRRVVTLLSMQPTNTITPPQQQAYRACTCPLQCDTLNPCLIMSSPRAPPRLK